MTLEMAIVGYHQRGGPWEVTEYRIVGEDGGVLLDLGRTEWADWDYSGDLVFAREGKLWRLSTKPLRVPVPRSLGQAIELADFRGHVLAGAATRPHPVEDLGGRA